jgi:hypothetical protein
MRRRLSSDTFTEQGGSAMLRLLFLYSLMTTVVGSSLLAEAPQEREQEQAAPQLVELPRPLPYTKPAPDTLAPVRLAPVEQAPASQGTEVPHSLVYSAPAPVPQTTWTATEHLQAAVRHLREAGFPEDADRIQRQLDEMLEIRLSELSEKRKQLEELQASVAEMEQQLGVASQYHLDCMLGELGPASGFATSTAAAAGTRKNLFKRTAGTGDMKDVLQAHLKNGTARVLAHSHLVARAGEPVAYLSGGEFPAVVPASGASLVVDSRPYGEQVVATITPLGGNRVCVNLRAELSELDHQVGVHVAGTKVPGVRSRSICSEFEMNVGETQMLVAPDSANGKSGFFAAITVRPLHPLGAAADAAASHAGKQTR